MRLFRCRPLATGCMLFVCCLILAYFLPLSLIFGFTLGFGIAALLLLVGILLRGITYPRLFLFLALLGLFLGSFRTLCDRNGVQKQWEDLHGQTVEVEFTVKDVLYASSYGGELLVDICQVEERSFSVCAVLRGEENLPFYTQDRIRAVVVVRELDFETYSDTAAYSYRAQGASALLVLEDTGSTALLESGTNSIQTRLLDLRARLSHRISRTVEGEQGKLLAAMLLGSKDMLSDQTVRNFRLSGVSHLLALSGLHLVILAGLIERFLYLLGAGRKLRITILFPLCLFYLMLTGCNYSLLRAMLMLGFVYLSAVFREDQDPLTSLLIAACVILLFAPYAIFSISFQMTVLATFGILAFIRIQSFFGSLLPKGSRMPTRLFWRFVRFSCSSLMLSVSTTVALLSVLWLEIGSYSLMTPLSNLILVPFAPLILLCAILALLPPFSFMGGALGAPASLLLWLAEKLADTQAVISLNEPYIPFIVIPTVLISILLLIIDLKRKYPLAILPAALCMIAFVLIFTVFSGLDQTLDVVYRQSGKNEGLVLVRGSQAMICDISGTGTTQLRADWREAQKRGATELSVLMLTHYHSKSVVALSRFSQSVILREIWVPFPQDESEREILANLLHVAVEREIQVTIFDANTGLTVFDTGILRISERLYRSRSAEPAFSLSLTYGAEQLCYHTASYEEYCSAMDIEHSCNAAHLILGSHGPVPKKVSEIPAPSAQSIVVGNDAYLAFYHFPQDKDYILQPSSFFYQMK